jgi:hypothetical protein
VHHNWLITFECSYGKSAECNRRHPGECYHSDRHDQNGHGRETVWVVELKEQSTYYFTDTEFNRAAPFLREARRWRVRSATNRNARVIRNCVSSWLGFAPRKALKSCRVITRTPGRWATVPFVRWPQKQTLARRE